MDNQAYQFFGASRCAKQWQTIGIQKRAGVATPLFSIYSEKSIGIGELPDLKLLADWCRSAGMTIIQLLPMNDVGFDFRPYDAQSSFAVEPMYLSISDILSKEEAEFFKSDLETLKKRFPPGPPRVNYQIKAAKLELLWRIFKRQKAAGKREFENFRELSRFWLRDYAVFKVLKELNGQKNWESWEPALKDKNPAAILQFTRDHSEQVVFQEWMQWQLYKQFKKVKAHAEKKGVLMLGDLPLLVSRDSADVWAHQDYFKLNLAAGAPPDLYIAKGQRWGMPPYDWDSIARHRYDYLIEKLRYAENFYDMFRIDHVVGIFRLWTIPLSEPFENGGLNGCFDPRDEALWEDHGRRLIDVMVQNTRMLPCAEDLGVVPPCSYKVLEEFGIPGMDVTRWYKDWGRTNLFKKPEEYRKNSIAVLSTHDMTPLAGWWQFEAGTVDEDFFRRKCEACGVSFEAVKDALFDSARSGHGRLRWRSEIENADALLRVLGRSREDVWHLVDLYESSRGEREKFGNFLEDNGVSEEDFSSSLMRKILEEVNKSASIFSVQLLQDWLAADPAFQYDPWNFRINFPGTMSEKNWTLVIPFSLEKIKKGTINRAIKVMHIRTGRFQEVKDKETLP